MDQPVYPSLIPQDDLDIHEHEHWSGLWNEELCASIEKQLLHRQAQWRSSDVGLSPTSPEIEYLYKYRTFEHEHPERTKEILREQKLWAASLHSLNDPMEAGFRGPNDAGDAAAAFSLVYLMRSQWCGCVSFSFDPLSTLMWSHYAGNHAGFCIRYRRRDSYLLSGPDCQPVLYRASMPQLSLTGPNRLRQIVNLVFWTKSEAWEQEREWRLRYPRAGAYTHPGLLKPDGVILGLQMKPDVRDLIREYAPDLHHGEIKAIGDDYRLSVAWEDEEASASLRAAKDEPASISDQFERVLAMSIEVAKIQLDEVGEFNPFGIVVYGNQAKFLMIDPSRFTQEGLRANQMIRRVEDLIREARAKEQLQFAGIIEDANIHPIEGGPLQSVISGRLEERGGPAVLFFQEYKLVSGKAQLGDRELISRTHHLIPESS